MSRIGKKAIAIPAGVEVAQSGRMVRVSGPMGNLQLNCHPDITVKIDSDGNSVAVVNSRPGSRRHKALHGTMRSLLANMVTGVSSGFEKKMEVFGTGYNVKQDGKKLVLQVGFSHPVSLVVPEDVKVQIDTAAARGNDVPARFRLSSCDKHLLGQFAANIRRVRPPEPYKGKGIRYADEVVRRKVGKAFASGTA